jgi:large subunit ribosomal protein L4e
MAKLQILDINGNKSKEISSDLFENEVRTDIIQKIVEAEKEWQPYAPFYKSGMQTSASGNVKHNRHVWKTDRGKGLSRYPKKRMSDKGERFVWVAAAIPGVKGGRRAHPPRVLRAELKINKKEQKMGFLSALAFISSIENVKQKYSGLKDKSIKITLPLIVDSKILTLKTTDFFEAVKKIVGNDLFEIAIQKAEVRAGIGKMRGRKYKKNAGMLLVMGNKQEKKIAGIPVITAKELKIGNLASNGARLVMFTDEAIKDLEVRFK